RADGDRGRHRLRDRVPARAARAPLPAPRAAVRRRLGPALHDSEPRALPAARAVHRAHLDDGRDRARLLHARHPLSEHHDRSAQRARRGARGGARHGPHALPGARARRAAPRGAGDHRRAAHRGRLDRCDRDDRRVPAARRARLSDLPRAEGTDALQDGDLLGRRARGRARAQRRCMPRRAAPARGAVDDGEGRLMLADAANLHTFVEAFRFIGDNPSFLLTKTLQQLELAGAALGIAALVALPVGVGLGHLHRGSGVAIGSSIVGRGLPSLVLIAAFLTVLGIGFVNNMVALAVLGSGPILTNAYNAVEGVDRDTVEAARGMGMTRRQILTRVELPLAVPLLFTGIRVAAVTIVAT